MKRNNCTIILVFFWCFFGIAQRDTIQVSKNDKVVLVLPEDISDSFIGNELNFFMDFKKDEGSSFSKRFLKLYYNERAVEKKDHTSLTVITTDGNSYEFTLELSKKPKKPAWYITRDQAVINILGNPNNTDYRQEAPNESLKTGGNDQDEKTTDQEPEKIPSGQLTEESAPDEKELIETTQPTLELYHKDPLEYYRLRCYYMQFDKPKLMRIMARKEDVFLWLKGVYYNENELYLQFRLENKEGVDLDINFLKFSTATAYKKSSSNQKTELESLFRFKIPKRVQGNTENHFVVVFKKFALDRNTVLKVDIDELNGNRDLSLEIDHHLINNPRRF